VFSVCYGFIPPVRDVERIKKQCQSAVRQITHLLDRISRPAYNLYSNKKFDIMCSHFDTVDCVTDSQKD